MLKHLKVNDIIVTKSGRAKIVKVGQAWPSENSPHRWALLTLALMDTGTVCYAAAREDELHPENFR
jgi:hypothetical protein